MYNTEKIKINMCCIYKWLFKFCTYIRDLNVFIGEIQVVRELLDASQTYENVVIEIKKNNRHKLIK